MNRTLLAALMIAAGVVPDDAHPRPIQPRRPPRMPPGIGAWPLSVACPTCKAGPGERCDRRTLGRHDYHMSRVEAAKDTP